MRYFKNILEFVRYFNGTIENVSEYKDRKVIIKTKYSISINNSSISILKHKGRYSIYFLKDRKFDRQFINNYGCWEYVEKELFKLDIFKEFIRDEKLKSILNI
jgi:hypothetical protein